jgi:SAM-dependent methyltransferase
MIGLLDSPVIWELSRYALDVTFGLYRTRVAKIQEWGLLSGRPSLLDIGCGIGHYARLTQGDYVGVDLSARYIKYARRRRGRAGRTFRCMDVAGLLEEHATFDIVLMVDLLHHLSDLQVNDLLERVAQLTRGSVVSFEPVTEQKNLLGGWIVRHDRGEHVRPLETLTQAFPRAGLDIVERQELWLGPIRTVAIWSQPANTSGRV